MTNTMTAVLAAAIFAAAPLAQAAPATSADRAFVAKVSQGGMFEVQAGRLADQKGSTPDVRDFGAMEVHDHTGVGDKLKAASDHSGITFASQLNPEFAGKLAYLQTLSGPAFDAAYMDEMATLHAADGAAFAREAMDGGSPEFRAFGTETHKIVQRHIGAIHAAAPPAK